MCAAGDQRQAVWARPAQRDQLDDHRLGGVERDGRHGLAETDADDQREQPAHDPEEQHRAERPAGPDQHARRDQR
jgi:hypothetical protein